MRKIYFTRLILILTPVLFIFNSCTQERTFTISYQMEDVKEYIPSYQLSIWIEKPDGTFVKTLFVSDYLAYGGYLEYGICPSWSKKANWDKVTKEELDAVSGATPEPGNVKLEKKFTVDKIPDGEYILFIQVHLQEDLNDTYKGKVKISGKESEAQIKPYKIKRLVNGKPKGILSNMKIVIN